MNNAIRVLLIEDDLDDADLLIQQLNASQNINYDVEHVTNISSGVGLLSNGHYDVVLLDLFLPDNNSLENVEKALTSRIDVPVIILTGVNDEELGLEALDKGAQDYLPKSVVEPFLLDRSIRYAIQRFKVMKEEIEAREKDIRFLEQLKQSATTSVTANIFGVKQLKDADPKIFDYFVKQYCGFLDIALENRVFKKDTKISADLMEMSKDLGKLRQGPKDVISIHYAALREKCESVPPKKCTAYFEEGRLLVLELMGYLVQYYRNYAFASIDNSEQ